MSLFDKQETEILKMRETVKQSNTGIVFVSFSEPNMAADMLEEIDAIKYKAEEEVETKEIAD